MSQTLTTNDAADVLDALLPAQNKSYDLGLALRLPPHEVTAIHTANRHPQDCLREVIIKFLEQAPESRRNWRVIVDALASRTVQLQALSEKVKAAHVPATSFVVSDSPAALTGDVPLDIRGGGIQLSAVTAGRQTGSHTWTRSGVNTKVQDDAAFGAVIGAVLFCGLVWETTEELSYRLLGMLLGAAVGAGVGAKHGVQALFSGIALVAVFVVVLVVVLVAVLVVVLVVGGWQMMIFLIETVILTAVGHPGTTAFVLLMTALVGMPLGRRSRNVTSPALKAEYIGRGIGGAVITAILAAIMGAPLYSTVGTTVVSVVVIVVLITFWAVVLKSI